MNKYKQARDFLFYHFGNAANPELDTINEALDASEKRDYYDRDFKITHVYE